MRHHDAAAAPPRTAAALALALGGLGLVALALGLGLGLVFLALGGLGGLVVGRVVGAIAAVEPVVERRLHEEKTGPLDEAEMRRVRRTEQEDANGSGAAGEEKEWEQQKRR